MQRLILIGVAALSLGALALPSMAATSSAPAVKSVAAGPYKLDATGRCHAANGQLVATALCKVVAPKCKTGIPCGATCISQGLGLPQIG